jgi:hypothetical protein
LRPSATPRAARREDGKWRAEVVIAHRWGDENVFRGGLAASQADALALAQRLVAAALVQEPTLLELPAPWK